MSQCERINLETIQNSQKASTGFTAPVIYAQPDFKELQHRFLRGHVILEYKDARIEPIERCKNVSRESREVTFECVYFGRFLSIEEVVIEMDHKGLRPALYEELLGFVQKYPNEQLRYPIIACGSLYRYCDARTAPYLSSNGIDFKYLSGTWVDCIHIERGHFLAVRE